MRKQSSSPAIHYLLKKLNIPPPPGFSLNPVSTRGIVGKSVTLSCVARAGSQPSSLTWYKDNVAYSTGVTSPSYDRFHSRLFLCEHIVGRNSLIRIASKIIVI